ncbi:hypothetical protein [Nonomuraea sp. NPDC049725]|uniref:hypothetical protein n=1 Tax=Nonomuraea sp. NPDC049725 TaxID=3154508 RepID=UPI00343E84D1
MPHDLDVAPEIADLLSREDLDRLVRVATVSYECWLCMRPGKLPDPPAVVIILRDGPVSVARLAHRFCSESLVVDMPDQNAMMYDPARAAGVDAGATFLPYQAGHRPALLLEVRATGGMDAGQEERDDRAVGWLLEQGLHLVATAGGEVVTAPGWTVHLRGSTGLRVTGPMGRLYDGELQVASAWRREVTAQGRCLLLVGVGMGLDQVDQAPHSMQGAIGRVDAVAQQGRLAGGLAAIDIT